MAILLACVEKGGIMSKITRFWYIYCIGLGMVIGSVLAMITHGIRFLDGLVYLTGIMIVISGLILEIKDELP